MGKTLIYNQLSISNSWKGLYILEPVGEEGEITEV